MGDYFLTTTGVDASERSTRKTSTGNSLFDDIRAFPEIISSTGTEVREIF